MTIDPKWVHHVWQPYYKIVVLEKVEKHFRNYNEMIWVDILIILSKHHMFLGVSCNEAMMKTW